MIILSSVSWKWLKPIPYPYVPKSSILKETPTKALSADSTMLLVLFKHCKNQWSIQEKLSSNSCVYVCAHASDMLERERERIREELDRLEEGERGVLTKMAWTFKLSVVVLTQKELKYARASRTAILTIKKLAKFLMNWLAK